MIPLNQKLSLITCTFGLLLVSSYSYAKAGINVYVENNCDKAQYIESQSDSIENAMKEIRPYQRIFLGYIDTGYLSSNVDIKYLVHDDNIKQNQLATVDIALYNYWSKNEYIVKSDNSDNVAIDVPTRTWQNWVGTPNVTIELCSKKRLEIAKGSLLDGVKRVIIFGDGLSDEGNLFSVSQGAVPSARNYYNGMFSNGNTWSASLRSQLSEHGVKMSNYAVGGATALSYADVEHLPYTLTDQTYMYHANALRENWHDANSTLAIIWIGGNDYLTQPASLDAKSQQQLTTDVIATIKAAIDALISAGINKFLIVNLPDLSRVPSSKIINKNVNVTHALTEQHNKKLQQMINTFAEQYPEGYTFKSINIGEFFQKFMDKSQRQGLNDQYHTEIVNIDFPCYQGGYSWINSEMVKVAYSAYSEQVLPSLINVKDMIYNTYKYFNACSNPEKYLFYDYVHPTSQMHKVIYEQIIKNVS